MAFNAKNLSYERNEPAFLRKLRGQHGGDSVRHERPVPRPRKLKENDDEDAPVYVDEETNEAISKEDYESLLNGTEATAKYDDQNAEAGTESTDPGKASEQAENEDAKTQHNLAEIGGSGISQKKRRQAKVIRDEEPDEESSRRQDGPTIPKSKAKRKKIKLSFDDPE